MSRSLRTRWMLALAAVCIVEAALVAVAVRAATADAFERFLVEEALVGFTADVEAAVRETGSVEGFRGVHRARRGDAPPRPPRADGPPRPLNDRRPPPPGRAAPPPGGGTIRFGLADAQGRLVMPFEGAPPGTAVPAAALARGEPILVDGRHVATALVPADVSAVLPGITPRSPEARFLRASSAALAGALGLALAVALGLGWALAGRTVRPLRALTAAADDLAAGDLGRTVAVETDDEVGRLAHAFNAMSARLAEATALRRRLTADVAHDLRTPLTAVIATLEAVGDGSLPATPARMAAAHAEAARLGRLVESLHTLALADAHELPVHPTRVETAGALRYAAVAVEAAAAAAGVTVVVEADGAPAACADPDRLAQVLDNLIGNALRHTPPGGRITLGAHADRAHAVLTVADTGEGIPADVLPHVFERSVRADAARSGDGSGLGLSIVRALVDAMGGRVGMASAPGVGTTATVRLPVWEERA